MRKELHVLTVRGDNVPWLVETHIDRMTAADWRDDGLEVDRVENTIPYGVAQSGYAVTRVWCFLQDLLNFRNPFRK